MRRGGLSTLAITACFLFSAEGTIRAQEAPQQAPPLRVSVNRVNMGVVVTDSKEQFVEGLRREDFELLDDGVAQPLTAFQSIEEPAQVVLMVECGPSVYFFRSDLIRTADSLLTKLTPSDRVAIVCYTRTPELRLDFTTDKEAARTALRELNFAQGFADLNLSASLFAVLDSLKPLPGKKTVVLVTSGVDMSPPADEETVRRKLAASDVRVLAVSTSTQLLATPKKQKLSKEQKARRSEVVKTLAELEGTLQQLSQMTGGHAYVPKSAKDFERVYSEIGDQVRHEYDLEFAPPVADGKLHTIEVRVKDQSYRVEHRQAYLAPNPG